MVYQDEPGSEITNHSLLYCRFTFEWDVVTRREVRDRRNSHRKGFRSEGAQICFEMNLVD